MRDTEGGAGPERASDRFDQRRLRFVRWVVFSAFILIALQIPFFATMAVVASTGEDGPALWRTITGAVLSVPLMLCTIRLLSQRMGRDRVCSGPGFWGSFALLLATVAALDLGFLAMFTAATWWSVAAVSVPRRWITVPTVVLLALPWIRAAFWLPETNWLLVLLVWSVGAGWTLVVLLGNLGTLWMWDLTNEAILGREARARLAVSEERLRFARDMHDLLGHSLSAIAVQSELAARLAERDPRRAAQEMRSAQRLAREALREVRAAVSGYREVDLDAETANVHQILTATGVRCSVTGRAEDIPAELRGLAAWVIREAGTNAIRHSSAKRCDIVIRHEGGAAVIEVYNDGASGSGADTSIGYGNGLSGLAERVAAARGTLTASRSGADGFLLRAVLPVEPGADREHIPARAPKEAEREETRA